MNFKSIKIGFSVVALALTTMTVQAQQEEHKNPNVRLGQKALMDGDFAKAITYFEKALPAEEKDPGVLYYLGYSQFQSREYQKAIVTFDKVIALAPTNSEAYYFKAKASNTLAVTPSTTMTDATRLDLLQSAISEYTKALAVNKSDAKLYQNRAIAYRDLGIIRSTEGVAVYNKAAAITAYNNAIVDYEKVLTFDSNRKDIQTELNKAKRYKEILVKH